MLLWLTGQNKTRIWTKLIKCSKIVLDELSKKCFESFCMANVIAFEIETYGMTEMCYGPRSAQTPTVPCKFLDRSFTA